MTGIVDGLLDLALPRRCVLCGAAGGWLCERCAAELHPLPVQHCPRCGAPGPWSAPGQKHRVGRRCPECGGRDLAFRSAAAAFTYEGPAKALITACKFRALRSLTLHLPKV